MLVAVEVVAGTTVNIIAFDAPPVELAFLTVMAVLPEASTFVADTVAVSCVGDMNVVGSSVADQ